MPPERLIDPHTRTRQVREQRMGTLTERQLVTQQDRAEKFTQPARPERFTITLGPWFRENIPANAGTIGMRLPEPTAQTIYGSSGTGVEITQQKAGRILGGAIWLNADLSAGRITLGVSIDNGATIPLSDVTLVSGILRRTSLILPWRSGIAFAAGQAVEPVLITDSSFSPTTIDGAVLLYLGFEVG